MGRQRFVGDYDDDDVGYRSRGSHRGAPRGPQHGGNETRPQYNQGTPAPYQFPFTHTVMAETPAGRLIEVGDTRSGIVKYVVHRWTREDKMGFTVTAICDQPSKARNVLSSLGDTYNEPETNTVKA